MYKGNRGQSLSEYLGVTALVAVAGITVIALFGDNLQTQFGNMAREIAGSSEQSEEQSNSSEQLLDIYNPNDDPDTAQDDTSEEVDIAVNRGCPLPGFGCGGSGLGGGSLGSSGSAAPRGPPSGSAAPAPRSSAPAQVPNRIGGRSLDDLSRSGRQLDPADSGGQLTRAGRALQKHGGRSGSAFPSARGNPSQINRAGQDQLDDILTSPGSRVSTGNRFGGNDVIAPNGRGARFDANGIFRGFLEPSVP